MPDQIEDGSGGGWRGHVTENRRLATQAHTVNDGQVAAEKGDAYNINTGLISLSGASDSALLYYSNTGTVDYHIETLVLGVGAGTASDMGLLTFINNPTGGDLITDATDVDMEQNRNAGSSNTLLANSYKGKDGGTITGGANVAQFFQGTSGRLAAPFVYIIPPGKSVAMKYAPNLSTGTVNVYAALIGHVNDPKDA